MPATLLFGPGSGDKSPIVTALRNSTLYCNPEWEKMPVVVRFRLVPSADTQLRLEQAPGQGWFLALVDRFHSQWASDLHGPGSVARSYTVSPLYRPSDVPLSEGDAIGDRALHSGRLRGAETVALRVSMADEAKAAALLAALPRLASDLPDLGTARCRLERIPRPSLDDPDLLVADWQEVHNYDIIRRSQKR